MSGKTISGSPHGAPGKLARSDRPTPRRSTRSRGNLVPAFRVGHQLDRPVRRGAHGMLAVSGAEVDRGRGPPALLAPQLHQRLRECPIAMIPNEQTHREYRLSTTAMQLETQVGPVWEALGAAA